jgi:hypothetical protein
MKNTIKYILIAIIVVGVLYLTSNIWYPVPKSNNAYSSNTSISSNISNQQLMPISITDPPQSPAGTQAIFINYSSVAVHEINSNGTSSWVYGNGSGRLDLMSLVNVSQVIGNVYTSSNATINLARFNITSAAIEINNTNYSVTVPNNQITAQIKSSAKVNSSSGVLVDLSPTIATIFTSNSTLFILIPLVKAIMIGNVSLRANSNIGTHFNIKNSEKLQFEKYSPNVSIISSSLSQENNSTDFSVTVKNNGNQSAVINHILLKGYIDSKIFTNNFSNEIKINNIRGNIEINTSVVNASANIENGVFNINPNMPITQTSFNGNIKPIFVMANASNNLNVSVINHNSSINSTFSLQIKNATEAKAKFNTAENQSLSSKFNSEININIEHVGLNLVHFKVFNFVITQNGTLMLPMDYNSFENVGYTLQPGATATLRFNSKISFGNGMIYAYISPDSNYTVIISGDNGVSASTNLIAS